MNATTSGVCLVRVEQQSHGLLLTLVTDRHDGSCQPTTQQFIAIDDAILAIREFLMTFRGGMTIHAD